MTSLLAVAWAAQLLRDGKPVVELKLTDCTIYEVPANWRAAVSAFRRNDGSPMRKIVYVAFLKKRYGYQIAAVNKAYGLDASAFTELESFDFSRLDEKRPEVLADDIDFAIEIFTSRVESTIRPGLARVRLVEVPDELPEAIVKALSSLAIVDGILVHGTVKGTANKPVVLWNCPAVKPAFATACLRI